MRGKDVPRHKSGKGGQVGGGRGGGKPRVIFIWRVKKEEKNSNEAQREAANMEKGKAGQYMKPNRDTGVEFHSYCVI